MKILIVGNGGREHALAWKCALSPLAQAVFVAPGNAGTAQEPKVKNIPIQPTQIHQLREFAAYEKIDLTLIGPEAPLAAGIYDEFHAHRLPCFGVSQKVALLETSKAYAKNFMRENGIPTADFAIFEAVEPALAFIEKNPAHRVIKADGLAAGKGVVVAENESEAKIAAKDMLLGQFGLASQKIVIEEKLSGEEASFMVVSDGSFAVPLPTSQDHKRRNDGDEGPNTGGMGAYSPAPILTPALQKKIMEKVVYPVLQAMASQGTPYKGFLYVGLMIDSEGDFKVLEFNCRLGDPETEPLLMRIQSDWVELMRLAEQGNLAQAKLEIDSRPTLGVVIADQGYPFNVQTGQVIDKIPEDSLEAKLFHAGTVERDGKILTQGGRVFCATAKEETLKIAQEKAYELVSQVKWENKYYRQDIGHHAL